MHGDGEAGVAPSGCRVGLGSADKLELFGKLI